MQRPWWSPRILKIHLNSQDLKNWDVCEAVARSCVCLLLMEWSTQIFERVSKQIPRSLSPFAWLLCHRKPPALAWHGLPCFAGKPPHKPQWNLVNLFPADNTLAIPEHTGNTPTLYDAKFTSIDRPSRLTIRLLFGFHSDSKTCLPNPTNLQIGNAV